MQLFWCGHTVCAVAGTAGLSERAGAVRVRLPPGNCVWGGAAGSQRICARPSAEVHHPLTPFAPAATAQEHDRSIGSLSPGALPPCWVSLADKFMTDTPTVADRCSMVFPAGGASRQRGAGPAGCPRAPPPPAFLPPPALALPCALTLSSGRGDTERRQLLSPRPGLSLPLALAGREGQSPSARPAQQGTLLSQEGSVAREASLSC